MAKLLATDETLAQVSKNLEQIGGALQVMSASALSDTLADPESLHKLIQSGRAREVLSVGDQIAVSHSEFGTLLWDIIGFDHDKDATGLFDHSLTVQLHSLLPTYLQFDARENEVATEGTFSSEYSYYKATDNPDVFKYLVPGTDYTVGAEIPADETFYHSAIQDTTGNIVRYGYNNWEHSAIRQYLNSEATAGNWWKAQHLGDVAPSYAARAGFLMGLDAEFKKIIGTTNKITALNKITDGGGSVQSVEKMFLLSRTEVMGGDENSVHEGDPYEYYKRLVGDTVVTGDCKNRIKYNGTTPYWWWLRAPGAGGSCDARYVYTTGYISYNNAYYGYGVAPACILV